MHGTPNGLLAADVRLRVVVPVVQERSALPVVAAQVTVAARVVLAEPVAASVRRPARRAVAPLPAHRARVHARAVAAREADSRLQAGRDPDG